MQHISHYFKKYRTTVDDLRGEIVEYDHDGDFLFIGVHVPNVVGEEPVIAWYDAEEIYVN